MKNLLKGKRVNFLVAGVQKAGTSALEQYLKLHPKIQMANKKEVHFFDNDHLFDQKKVKYSKYHGYFDWKDRSKLFGEATPIYTYWSGAMKRIYEYNPQMKLIVILRNPLHRAFSQWGMEHQRKRETKDFGYCIRNERTRMRKALPKQHMQYSYVDRGLYSEQVRRLQRYFPDDQLCFIKYEDFRQDQKQTLSDIFNFLNLDPEKFNYTFKEERKTRYKSEMSKKDKKYLLDFYQGDILSVQSLLGWDCSDWMK